jgi:hypothetical protein
MLGHQGVGGLDGGKGSHCSLKAGDFTEFGSLNETPGIYNNITSFILVHKMQNRIFLQVPVPVLRIRIWSDPDPLASVQVHEPSVIWILVFSTEATSLE